LVVSAATAQQQNRNQADDGDDGGTSNGNARNCSGPELRPTAAG
jgi:hypothetical protein